jgi:Lecithin retinol acyltransferase
MGDRRVIHISDDNNSKRCARAREDSWNNFIGVKKDGSTAWFGTISVMVYRLRIRTPEEIMDAAKLMASESYGQGEYNFALKNCQDFASYCCTGKEMSAEAYRALDTLLLGLLPVLAIIPILDSSPLSKEP